MNGSNMFVKIGLTFERLVASWMFTRNPLGLIEVVDVFEMFCEVFFPREGFITVVNRTLVLRRTVIFSYMMLETGYMFISFRTVGITALMARFITVSVSNMDVECFFI